MLLRPSAPTRARSDDLERRAMLGSVAFDGTPTRVYLALGDSLAAGIGASNRQSTAYVPLFYHFLSERLPCASGCSRLRLENFGVSGATAATLISDQLPRALDLVRAGSVKVVSIDVGANDVLSQVEMCSSLTPIDCLASVQVAMSRFADDFGRIIRELRLAGGPGLSIVAMTYYNSVPTCDLSHYSSLAELLLEGGPFVGKGLNAFIRDIAAGYSARVADLAGKLTPTDYTGGADCWHPRDSGYAKIADQFAAAWSAPP